MEYLEKNKSILRKREYLGGKPEYLETTRVTGDNTSFWRQRGYLEKARVSGESKSIWRKQEYLDKTRVSGENGSI